jgi:hypothetical protein
MLISWEPGNVGHTTDLLVYRMTVISSDARSWLEAFGFPKEFRCDPCQPGIL